MAVTWGPDSSHLVDGLCGQAFAKIQYLAVCGQYFQALVISNGKEEAAVCGQTFAKIQYFNILAVCG